ncbi:MAG: hypothetical protein LBQ24_06695 [Candidatus Peribacteria bacterium]|nr:hypothetical protein [Candidatus Peribacteria bacterium]
MISQFSTSLQVSLKSFSSSQGKPIIKSAQILTSIPSSLCKFLVCFSKSFMYSQS